MHPSGANLMFFLPVWYAVLPLNRATAFRFREGPEVVSQMLGGLRIDTNGR